MLLEGQENARLRRLGEHGGRAGYGLPDANVDEVDGLPAANVVDAEDVGVCDDDLFECGIVAGVGGDVAENIEHLVGVGAGVHADLERRYGEVAGEVGDGCDLTVGDAV